MCLKTVKGFLGNITISNVRLDFSAGLIVMVAEIVKGLIRVGTGMIRHTLILLGIIALFSVEMLVITMGMGHLTHSHVSFDASVIVL